MDDPDAVAGHATRGVPGRVPVRVLVGAALAVACSAGVIGAVAATRSEGARPRTGAQAGPPAASPEPVVTVVGSGFGHGVGLSQYGARGMAGEGASAAQILRHYYSGTEVRAHRDAVDLRVNVVDRGTRVTLRTAALAAGGGSLRLLPTGGTPLTLGTRDTAVITPVAGGLAVTVTRSGGGKASFTARSVGVRWSGARAMAGPATVLRVDSRSAASSSTKTRRYRWGSLGLISVPRTDPDGVVRPRIEGNLLVNLHREYLRGVAEVPFSWPDATLRAQVVAARNYALTQVGRSPAGCGGCHLWDDTRSQVYRGWDTETVGARWVRAVTATQTSSTGGLTVLYRGTPITAYYSAATGGRTRDAAAVWGTAVPYLRAVDDRWSTDPSVNPGYASWTRSVPLAVVLRVVGLPDLACLAVTGRDASGAVTELRATSSDGTVRTLPGSVLRGSGLGLPAQWVTSITLPAASAPPSGSPPAGSPPAGSPPAGSPPAG